MLKLTEFNLENGSLVQMREFLFGAVYIGLFFQGGELKVLEGGDSQSNFQGLAVSVLQISR